MPDRRILLKEYVTDDMVMTEAHYNDWLWWDETSRDEETIRRDRIYEIIFIKPGQETSIHYIEDYMVKLCYILARGEEADKVIEETKNSLDCYSWQEIVNYYDTNKDDYKEKIGAVYLAGIAAPLEFSSEHKKFFDNSLQDEHPDVRIATIVAMGYMSWDEWIPVLYDLKNNDPDKTVRDSAAGMLESFAANGKDISPSDSQVTEAKTVDFNEPLQLEQKIKEDKKQLKNLQSQLKRVEERIKQAQKTNIFGRKQSGNDERERDRLTQEIEDIKQRIKQNESLLETQDEQ